MSAQPQLSPELEEVLRDVAVDPQARLLRVSPRAVALGLRTWREEASPAQAGLTGAERELLAVHRAELAWVLREAGLRAFHANTDRSWRAQRVDEAAAEREWEDRQAMTASLPIGRGDTDDAVRLVQSLSAPRASELLPEELFEMSMRVELHPSASVFLANEHISMERYPEARLALAPILHAGPPGETRVAALLASAGAAEGLGHHRAWSESVNLALEGARRVAGSGDWSGRAIIASFHLALKTDDATRCAGVLEDVSGQPIRGGEWVDAYAEGLERDVDRYSMSMGPACRAVLKSGEVILDPELLKVARVWI